MVLIVPFEDKGTKWLHKLPIGLKVANNCSRRLNSRSKNFKPTLEKAHSSPCSIGYNFDELNFDDVESSNHHSSTAFLLYQISDEHQHSQFGICSAVSIEDYLNGTIKKHENIIHSHSTKSTKKNDYVDICPVMMTFRSRSSITEIMKKVQLNEPDFTYPDLVTGLNHTLWRISDMTDVSVLIQEFGLVESLYIADGHHRMASMAKEYLASQKRNKHKRFLGGKNDYVMAVMYPSDQMKIHSFHRLVQNTPKGFLEKVQERFDVVKVPIELEPIPVECGTMSMYYHGQWFFIREKRLNDWIGIGRRVSGRVWEKSTLEDNSMSMEYKKRNPAEELDVQILFDELLSPVLGLEDIHTPEIGYLSSRDVSITTLEQKIREENCRHAVAFCLKEVSVEDVMKVADAGLVMPPKATCFEHKVPAFVFSRVY